jgi:hypothetical protein
VAVVEAPGAAGRGNLRYFTLLQDKSYRQPPIRYN